MYLELIRTTRLVQLYLISCILAPIFGIDRFWTGFLALAFFEGAFGSESFRTGILSVSRDQRETSAGPRSRTSPHLPAHRLPGAVLGPAPSDDLLINLIEHSAIVSTFADLTTMGRNVIADLTTAGRNVIAETYLSFEIWFTVATMYLVMTIAPSLLASVVERRLKRPYRPDRPINRPRRSVRPLEAGAPRGGHET